MTSINRSHISKTTKVSKHTILGFVTSYDFIRSLTGKDRARGSIYNEYNSQDTFKP